MNQTMSYEEDGTIAASFQHDEFPPQSYHDYITDTLPDLMLETGSKIT